MQSFIVYSGAEDKDNLPNGKGRLGALKQPKILEPNKPCFMTLPVIEVITGTFKKVFKFKYYKNPVKFTSS